jgi:hypothetical protein
MQLKTQKITFYYPPGSIVYNTVTKYLDVTRWFSFTTPNKASQMRISAKIHRLFRKTENLK